MESIVTQVLTAVISFIAFITAGLHEASGLTQQKGELPAGVRNAVIQNQSDQLAPSSSTENGIFGVSIGQNADEVIQVLGQPQRKDPSLLGGEWWIYNQSLDRYVQVGILNGRVVDIFSNSSSWSFSQVKPRDSRKRLESRFTIKNEVMFDYDGAAFTLANDMKEKPIVMNDSYAVIFYLDIHENSKVTGIRFLSKEALVKSRAYPIQWTYDEKAPDLSTPTLTDAQKLRIERAYEKQILDLTNVSRTRYNLSALSWNESASQVARGHSLDMLANHFFDHISTSTGLNPFERMQKHGIRFKAAGENIAAGYYDAIDAHAGWMNSLGHRENILNSTFTTLGVGVKAEYYTENFVTP